MYIYHLAFDRSHQIAVRVAGGASVIGVDERQESVWIAGRSTFRVDDDCSCRLDLEEDTNLCCTSVTDFVPGRSNGCCDLCQIKQSKLIVYNGSA